MSSATHTQSMERWVSGLLRAGVWTSAGLIAAGLALWLVANPGLWTQPDLLPDLLTRQGPKALSPAATAGRIAVLSGLIVLIITPILRVMLSVITFSRAGERAFAWLSAVVLALLALSVTLGLGWR